MLESGRLSIARNHVAKSLRPFKESKQFGFIYVHHIASSLKDFDCSKISFKNGNEELAKGLTYSEDERKLIEGFAKAIDETVAIAKKLYQNGIHNAMLLQPDEKKLCGIWKKFLVKSDKKFKSVILLTG